MLTHNFSHYYYSQKCWRMVPVVASVISASCGEDEVLGVEFHSICKLGAYANTSFHHCQCQCQCNLSMFFFLKEFRYRDKCNLVFHDFVWTLCHSCFNTPLWCCSLLAFALCLIFSFCGCYLAGRGPGKSADFCVHTLWSNWSPHIVVSKWKLATLHMIFSVTISNCLAQY